MSPAIHNAHLQEMHSSWMLVQLASLNPQVYRYNSRSSPLAGVHSAPWLYGISSLLPGHFTQPEHLNQVKWQDWTKEVEQAYQELAITLTHWL